MRYTIEDEDGDYLTVEAGAETIAADGEVRVFGPATERTVGHDEPSTVISYTPAQARELAAALDRAADEAESGTSVEARLRTELAAIDDVLREAGIEYPLGVRGVKDLAGMLELAREGDDE
ncbi:hypothetical protein [Streptomyces albipurpureus]|uniref:Uncharacterized protein n=1 Tax=Streptomyces albipurpureus TaxID=2897419 RepID=A0ABT0UWN7_9ACTN|nr:hypothetical protein [Streptomyces sp. CWNU-1]MCM2391763.1 hypothetical protein [Streptomyces sp. CWNU-1]